MHLAGNCENLGLRTHKLSPAVVGEDKDMREVGWDGEGAYAAGTAGLLGAGVWGVVHRTGPCISQEGGRQAESQTRQPWVLLGPGKRAISNKEKRST